ncbi:hypothetical protein EHP00_1518 [Ecytonucleospora hepatopenaei]|uniref:Uncharacterized protein n=1 Tax=Ecytonucleospora hepatopenaei TaxID=646526 RepID=A0A1W0E3U9_9MICR|nr:hypothetical protein EHP00_1518 [Ecytonucleospora hepatopenaei]
MLKQITYKEYTKDVCEGISSDKNKIGLDSNYIYYINKAKKNEIFKYDFEKNMSEGIKICGESIFCILNALFVLNGEILTIYNKDKITNFNIQQTFFKVKLTDLGLIFFYENYIDCILAENTKGNLKQFYRITIDILEIQDLIFNADFVYFLTKKEFFKLKNVVLNKCNEYKLIGNTDVVKLNAYLSIKKTFICKNNDNFTHLHIYENIVVFWNNQIFNKSILHDNLLKIDFIFSQKNLKIDFCHKNYVIINNILVEIKTGLHKILSSHILCAKNNMFLSYDKIYFIDNVSEQKETNYLCFSKYDSYYKDLGIEIDVNSLNIPDFLSEDEKLAFIEFKIKYEKWKRFRDLIKNEQKRTDLIKELVLLKETILKEVKILKEKEERCSLIVKMLSEKANKLKIGNDIDINLLKNLKNKINSFKNNHSIGVFYEKLCSQRCVLKDILNNLRNKL